jgi:hypothetical protein
MAYTIIATSYGSSSSISNEKYSLKVKIGRAKLAAKAFNKKNQAEEALIQENVDRYARKASSGFEGDRQKYGKMQEEESTKKYKLWSMNQEKEAKLWEEIERLEAEVVLLDQAYDEAWVRERDERGKTENAVKAEQEQAETAVNAGLQASRMEQLHRLSVNARLI